MGIFACFSSCTASRDLEGQAGQWPMASSTTQLEPPGTKATASGSARNRRSSAISVEDVVLRPYNPSLRSSASGGELYAHNPSAQVLPKVGCIPHRRASEPCHPLPSPGRSSRRTSSGILARGHRCSWDSSLSTIGPSPTSELRQLASNPQNGPGAVTQLQKLADRLRLKLGVAFVCVDVFGASRACSCTLAASGCAEEDVALAIPRLHTPAEAQELCLALPAMAQPAPSRSVPSPLPLLSALRAERALNSQLWSGASAHKLIVHDRSRRLSVQGEHATAGTLPPERCTPWSPPMSARSQRAGTSSAGLCGPSSGGPSSMPLSTPRDAAAAACVLEQLPRHLRGLVDSHSDILRTFWALPLTAAASLAGGGGSRPASAPRVLGMLYLMDSDNLLFTVPRETVDVFCRWMGEAVIECHLQQVADVCDAVQHSHGLHQALEAVSSGLSEMFTHRMQGMAEVSCVPAFVQPSIDQLTLLLPPLAERRSSRRPRRSESNGSYAAVPCVANPAGWDRGEVTDPLAAQLVAQAMEEVMQLQPGSSPHLADTLGGADSCLDGSSLMTGMLPIMEVSVELVAGHEEELQAASGPCAKVLVPRSLPLGSSLMRLATSSAATSCCGLPLTDPHPAQQHHHRPAANYSASSLPVRGAAPSCSGARLASSAGMRTISSTSLVGGHSASSGLNTVRLWTADRFVDLHEMPGAPAYVLVGCARGDAAAGAAAALGVYLCLSEHPKQDLVRELQAVLDALLLLVGNCFNAVLAGHLKQELQVLLSGM